MTEPAEVKLKAQNSAVTIPNARNKYLRLQNVYKLIDQAYKAGIESVRFEPLVGRGASSADEICGCGGKIKSYGIAGEKYCEYCDKPY